MDLSQLKALHEIYLNQEEIQDRRIALICTVLANCFRDPKKRAIKIEDFMPQKPKKKQEQKPQDMIQMIRLWNASLGGKEK